MAGRNEESEGIRKEFLDALKELAEEKGFEFIMRPYSGAEIYLFLKKPLLYGFFVKISTSKKGFWGLPEKLHERFDRIGREEESSLKYSIALLTGHKQRGYLLDHEAFNEVRQKLSKSQDQGQWKINEKILKDNHIEESFNVLDEIYRRLE